MNLVKSSDVKVDDENLLIAETIHNHVVGGLIISAFALKTMLDEQHYKSLGCKNAKEYIVRFLPFGKSEAYNYKLLADRFSNILKVDPEFPRYSDHILRHDAIKGVQPVGLLGSNQNLSELWKIGIKKNILLLNRLNDSQMANFMKIGSHVNKAGEVIWISDLAKYTYTELAEFLDEAGVNDEVDEAEIIPETADDFDYLKESKALLEHSQLLKIKLEKIMAADMRKGQVEGTIKNYDHQALAILKKLTELMAELKNTLERR